MGISMRNFNVMQKSFKKAGIITLKDKNLLELGNQHIRRNVRKKYKINFIISKEYFESLGCKHVSIDWNAKEGSIPLDLSKPINDKKLYNKFDIITNFGTLEHIINGDYCGQWQAWKNIHDMAKKETIFIHSLPLINSWPTHCKIHYKPEFITNLAKENNYEILFFEQTKLGTKKALISVCLKKINLNPFMENKEKFKKWIEINE